MGTIENEEIEIQLLLEALYQKYGYDFRNYAKASLKRRIQHRLSLSGMTSISEMQHNLLYDEEFFETLLLDFSINVSDMFRDPAVFYSLRKHIFPFLKTYPFFRIWVAGCSTGEEVYSLAILLQEEGLYKRAQIYATDYNEVVLEKAKEGIYPISNIKEYTSNYQKSGGSHSFTDYYTAHYEAAIMNQSLKDNITFAAHNLTTDGIFNEMQMICCRNVMIYFNKDLQNHVYKLFLDSLSHGGILCLGSKENLKFSTYANNFAEVMCSEKIYRKKNI